MSSISQPYSYLLNKEKFRFNVPEIYVSANLVGFVSIYFFPEHFLVTLLQNYTWKCKLIHVGSSFRHICVDIIHAH